MDKKIIIFRIFIICFLFICFSMPAFAISEDKVQAKVIRKKITQNRLKKNISIRTSGKSLVRESEILRPKSDIAKTKPTIGKIKKGTSSIKPTEKSAKKNGLAPIEKAPYDPTGKIDPFTPIIKSDPKPPKTLVTYIDQPSRPTTDLEKVELSQLKLKGVILASSGNRGLVQESSGRGHIVKIDTRIGRRGGKVVKINKDRIIVQERLRDYSGKIIIKKRALLSAAKLDNSQ
jgi:Tfp pilus assembly protein PilP